MSTSNIPQAFLCPISFEIMKDPVVGNDGHTYEKEHIVKWLEVNKKSPMTREPMSLCDLKPNYALRSMIDSYLLKNESVKGDSSSNVAGGGRKENKDVPLTLFKGNNCMSVLSSISDSIPLILLMVIDSSGSMDWPADSKVSQEKGMFVTRRDLVKHSARTVMMMLHEQPNTSVSIQHFSDGTRTLLPLTKIGKSPLGLRAANDAIDALPAVGRTNLWDGLRSGLVEARRCAEANPEANIQMIVLTDGEPTEDYNPHGGIASAFQTKMSDMPKNVTVNCFGFGYSLDTNLLDKICTAGHGLYGYIPDSSMVATVFINFCAHVLSTVALNVEPYPGIHLRHIQANHPFLVRVPDMKGEGDEAPKEDCLKAIEMVIHAIASDEKDFAYISSWIKTCLADMASGEGKNFLQALLDDIQHDDPNKGQLTKAVSQSDWYNSWGKNHLLSYRRALQLQVCVNFKDQALQKFVGPLCKELQDQGKSLFLDLPSLIPSGYSPHGNQTNAPATPIDMTQFVARDGGCFSGSSLITLQGGKKKRADECVKGDILSNGSIIQCVVRTKLDRVVKMCSLGPDFYITPWHPVVSPVSVEKNNWEFPCMIRNEVEVIYLDAFYDFVVEGGNQWAFIEGYKVAMLGHEMTHNSVIEHPYYGTQEVIRVLQSKEGWLEGLVDL